MKKVAVNSITTIRFLCSLLLPIILWKVNSLIFLITIILLFLTDTVDGFLARRWRVQTFYGAFMDTVADKTLNIVLLICLLETCPILWVILIGEISIFAINAVAILQGKKTRASIFGKTKMWLVAFSIIFGYLYYFGMCEFVWVFSGSLIAFMSQLVTIIDYIKTLVLEKRILITQEISWKKVWFDTDFYLKNKV